MFFYKDFKYFVKSINTVWFFGRIVEWNQSFPYFANVCTRLLDKRKDSFDLETQLILQNINHGSVISTLCEVHSSHFTLHSMEIREFYLLSQ